MNMLLHGVKDTEFEIHHGDTLLNDWDILNISRYVSTAKEEEEIDLEKVNKDLIDIERKAKKALDEHNKFLAELGLPPIPD